MTPENLIVAQTALAVVGSIGAVVTAVATFFLWRVTRSLAIETKRLVEAGSTPHVVATIEPNKWSMMHADIHIQNSGNATAYNIEVSFDPPLQNGEARSSDRDIPLRNLSVLKPGQGASSYLSEFGPMLNQSYAVRVSWRRDPRRPEREENTYTLDMRPFRDITQLGASDPLIQIADQIKKIREDWDSVARGSQKLGTNIFTATDRLHERRQIERRRRAHRRQASESAAVIPQSTEPEDGA